MYQNESIDDYIRSILGYPNNGNMYMDNNQMDYSTMDQQTQQEQELENCYPDIYRKVYPLINNRCSRISEPITSEMIDNIADEIYSAVEVTNEVNLNINLQNTTGVTNSRPENRTTAQKEISKKEDVREVRSENRQIRNRTLQDLIKILIIRELLNRRRRPRPPFHGRLPFPGGPGGRPPFPGGPGGGRPPMMPRGYSDYDLYEHQY